MPDPKPSTAAPRLKLVIRRLPPTIPEPVFWRSVAPWIDEGKSTWRKWYPGKKADDSVRQHRVFSRAYVMMADFDRLQTFATAFDGHVFRGKDGSEYQAVVEYAPSQKIPSLKSKPRVDARQGQIDKDPDYLSFLESLAAPITKPEVTTGKSPRAHSRTTTNLAFTAPSEPFDNRKSTPLLEFLKEQRMGAKRTGGGTDGKSLQGTSSAYKDPSGGRNKKDKERERTDKKRGVAAGNGEKHNPKQPAKSTTGGSSSVPPTAVPGQIKIAKRPTGDDQPGKDTRPASKKAPPMLLPETGKRADVMINPRVAGSGTAPHTGGNPLAGQGGRGKRGQDAGRAAPGDTKLVKGEGSKTVGDGKGKNKDPVRQPQQGQDGDAGIPRRSQQQQRGAGNPGARNLLSAALKSSTRDRSATAGEGEKTGRGRGGAAGKGATTTTTAAAAGTSNADSTGAGVPSAPEKTKRPRNRGRKPAAGAGGGDGAPSKSGGDQPGAGSARIDA